MKFFTSYYSYFYLCIYNDRLYTYDNGFLENTSHFKHNYNNDVISLTENVVYECFSAKEKDVPVEFISYIIKIDKIDKIIFDL